MKDAVLEAANVDMDTRIREAEARIIEADLQWKRHSDQLAGSVRGRASQIAWLGGAGIGAVVAGAVLLRWRSSAKRDAAAVAASRIAASAVRPPARSAAASLRAAAAQAIRAAPGRPPVPVPVTIPATQSRAWHGAMTTLGTVLGSAARSGLSLPSKPGVVPVLMGAGLPLLTRWLRANGRKAR